MRAIMVYQNESTGFTLIEVAIVLVVIGLLLGGVLKGQELIGNTKVKAYAADFRNVPVALYGYQDRFKALPGDDPNVVSHLAGATKALMPASAQGNGVIDGPWDTTDGTNESCLFWQHVRLANLAPGPTNVDCSSANSTYLPRNTNGGRIGIQSNTGLATITGQIPGTYVVCSNNIPGQYVSQIDTLLDDGDPQTGSVRAILQSAAPGPPSSASVVANNPAEVFTVCMGI
jgi:prepilin-type N-terminal cleavage/methylation domain-containing protein